ncbi:MAG: HAMP domain-containing histidine kinase [Sedimentisphaerales bacterium]|nr:HAMP domain-containing histidine kinase [Sedimentisphaerales bacterium]
MKAAEKMYKRLAILSVIIFTALCGLSWMGYRSIQMRAKGMEGTRIGEFAEVAEQIRQDIKRKLDEFMQVEQNRPYTDYQYYYVPESAFSSMQQQVPLVRSPLNDRIENSFAYGNFQIEPDGKIVTPYYQQGQQIADTGLSNLAVRHISNIEQNLLPVLSATAGAFKLPASPVLLSNEKKAEITPKDYEKEDLYAAKAQSRRGKYAIESLKQEAQQEQVISQRRSVAVSNVQTSDSVQEQQARQRRIAEPQALPQSDAVALAQEESSPVQMGLPGQSWQQGLSNEQEDLVQIRIEPFVPVIVDTPETEQSIFDGQVFMLRHVQIEDRHFLQGFQLNEKKLIEEIGDSAKRFMRDGMDFDLAQTQDPQAAFTAILDFGFGGLALNLIEMDPAWIGRQINRIQNWYFSIITIVFLAVMLGLASLWRNVRAQVKLAQKKDDFISAVSHELRTPLTSIRMYSEMLEKKWVKSEDKVNEYYRNMRQESERLSRLIENVLDFSRIQKGRKKYTFSLGDINQCIANVVEMMRPYAAQNGFSIKTDFQSIVQTVFDNDAVAQIVVNLLDNAVKYARDAEDKTITIRTKDGGQFVLIEVQDHGPGVPRQQRKKVFEEFYRIGSEARRETNGTGLGLALVKKFAQAHNGFVEILSAKPSGAVFRVGLAVQS